MTPRQLAYQEYLKSDHWAKLRNRAFARDGHKCVECGKRWELEGHHKLYRERFEDGVLEDIVTLCFEHHRAKHPEKQVAVIVPIPAWIPVRKPKSMVPVPDYCKPGYKEPKKAWKGKKHRKAWSKMTKKMKKRLSKLRKNKGAPGWMASRKRPVWMDYSEYQRRRDGIR